MPNQPLSDPTGPVASSILAPAERVLREAEELNRRAGHENDGFLSVERGFVPLAAPLEHLPESFAAWDALAAELPALYASLELRPRIERLPLLDASRAALDDRSLLRAAALLAILSHAYWYVDCRPPARLPDALRVPWSQVRARLGRQEEVLSYVDLIVYNWRARIGQDDLRFSIEQLDLLFPIAGNQEERIFYLTQLEILARASPLPSLMAAAQAAARRSDPSALEALILRIAGVFASSTAALARIDPRVQGDTHVDPVRWAKTVAPIAVPFRRGVLGPSGTSSPLFNTLDAFFGRAQFDSPLGREIRQLRRTYPPAWQRFIHALEAEPVSAFVARCQDRSLGEAWEHALAQYGGRNGFLSRHRRKVYGYLEIAFKVGRSLTIGGFGGAFADRTWIEVDAALANAHAERPRAEMRPRDPPPSAAMVTGRTRAIDVSEIAQHNQPESGYWLVVDGSVYDVTRFIASHPGGRSVLRAYAGLDASAGFRRAHEPSPRIARLRGALQIGIVRELPFDDVRHQRAHRSAVAALSLLVEMQNAFALDRSFSLADAEGGASGAEPAPYERLRALERHARFLTEYVAVLEGQTLPALWSSARAGFPDYPGLLEPVYERVRGSAAASTLRADASRALASFDRSAAPQRTDAAGDCDARLLAELKGSIASAVRAFERKAPRLDQAAARRVHRSYSKCIAALRRYYQRSAACR